MTNGNNRPSLWLPKCAPGLIKSVAHFFESLSFVNKTLFILGTVPLPVYILQGHFFDLLAATRGVVKGYFVSPVSFAALLLETLLILYAAALILQFCAGGKSTLPSLSKSYGSQIHGCIVVKPVPLYLLHEEKKSHHQDDTEFLQSFAGLDPEDKVVVEKLPQALEILQHNAAMLDIYHRYHPEEHATLKEQSRSRSLMDILREHEQLSIDSEADINKLVQS